MYDYISTKNIKGVDIKTRRQIILMLADKSRGSPKKTRIPVKPASLTPKPPIVCIGTIAKRLYAVDVKINCILLSGMFIE